MRKLVLSNCPLQNALNILGGKWKPVIIFRLHNSTTRFGQLHSQITGISRKVLTTHLQELEEDGLVLREAYAETPPRVEYSLTEKGKELIPIFQSLAQWGEYLAEENNT